MFIRYNSATSIWEYDTSAAQSGAGPWLILPNVPFLDHANVFSTSQIIRASGPQLSFNDISGAANSKFYNILETGGDLYFQTRNDDGSFQLNAVRIGRSGTIYERGRANPIGKWIDVPYNAANFTGSGAMTWTVEAGDQVTFSYYLVGDTITVNLFIQSTSVGGTRDSYLMVNVPGFPSTRNVDSITKINDAGTQLGGLIRIFPGESLIRFHKVDSTAWNLATNVTAVYAQFSYPIA